MKAKLVWGLPIRLFHWSLVILLCVSFYTGEFGDFDSIDIHMWAGYGLLTLLMFRLGFGFLAQGYARFSQFVRGPRATLDYLKAPTETAGHNPMGALGIVVMLISLTLQVGTGLFATDDIFVEGPLNHLVSSSTAGLLTSIHAINKWVLLGLIATHLLAILVHEWRLGHRLVLPMITGKKQVSDEVEPDRHQFGRASVCLGIAGALAYYLVNEV